LAAFFFAFFFAGMRVFPFWWCGFEAILIFLPKWAMGSFN
jgi:hypothetical protein